MCGIVGVVGIDRGEQKALCAEMLGAVRHRGPDGGGIHSTRCADVGACRLSLVDVEGGVQPMRSDISGLAVVFNGEIYNHQELRSQLVARGHRFRTRADTEVILHLYEEYGEECVDLMQGMFAFVVVGDEFVYLARDRLGIKPLHLASIRGGRTLLFASELKALLRCSEVDRTVDTTPLADSFILNHGTGRNTLFRSIRSLRPGHWMLARDSSGKLEIQERQYFQLSVCPDPRDDLEGALDLLEATLVDSVRTHAECDFEAGLHLSGGVDSGLIAWIAAQERLAFRSHTVTCDPEMGDAEVARRYARSLGLEHSEELIDFRSYVNAIPRFVWASENVPSLYPLTFFILCQRISEKGRVYLNGEGADELFAGYPEYVHPRSERRRLVENLNRAERLGLPVSERVRQIVESLVSTVKYGDYLRKALELYQQDQLEFNHLTVIDRCSMAAGVEVRVPFLDDKMVEVVNSLPLSFKVPGRLRISKYILKRLFLRLAGELAYDPVLRSKEGLPSSGRQHLDQFVRFCSASIPDNYVAKHPYRRYFANSDESDGGPQKCSLLLFDLFHYQFVKRGGILDGGLDMQDFVAARSGDGQSNDF